MSSKKYNGREQKTARKIAEAQLGQPCFRCGIPVLPGQAWHADHVKSRYHGGTAADGIRIAHAKCNMSAGGKDGSRITNAKRATKSTEKERTAKFWREVWNFKNKFAFFQTEPKPTAASAFFFLIGTSQ